MKFLWIALIVMILALQTRLWAGEGSFVDVWRLQEKVAMHRVANERLISQNARLNAEVLDLKNGYDAIQERARTHLGMIHRNETFFLVVDR